MLAIVARAAKYSKYCSNGFAEAITIRHFGRLYDDPIALVDPGNGFLGLVVGLTVSLLG